MIQRSKDREERKGTRVSEIERVRKRKEKYSSIISLGVFFANVMTLFLQNIHVLFRRKRFSPYFATLIHLRTRSKKLFTAIKYRYSR